MFNQLLNSYKEFLIVREYSKPEERSEKEKRLLFLVDNILDLTTYCEDYSLKIGEIVLDIMKYISSKRDVKSSKYDYSREQWEFDYIVYVQFIIEYLEWGTNIYHAWFDSNKEIEGIKLTSENVSRLIEWFDNEDDIEEDCGSEYEASLEPKLYGLVVKLKKD